MPLEPYNASFRYFAPLFTLDDWALVVANDAPSPPPPLSAPAAPPSDSVYDLLAAYGGSARLKGSLTLLSGLATGGLISAPPPLRIDGNVSNASGVSISIASQSAWAPFAGSPLGRFIVPRMLGSIQLEPPSRGLILSVEATHDAVSLRDVQLFQLEQWRAVAYARVVPTLQYTATLESASATSAVAGDGTLCVQAATVATAYYGVNVSGRLLIGGSASDGGLITSISASANAQIALLFDGCCNQECSNPRALLRLDTANALPPVIGTATHAGGWRPFGSSGGTVAGWFTSPAFDAVLTITGHYATVTASIQFEHPIGRSGVLQFQGSPNRGLSAPSQKGPTIDIVANLSSIGSNLSAVEITVGVAVETVLRLGPSSTGAHSSSSRWPPPILLIGSFAFPSRAISLSAESLTPWRPLPSHASVGHLEVPPLLGELSFTHNGSISASLRNRDTMQSICIAARMNPFPMIGALRERHHTAHCAIF